MIWVVLLQLDLVADMPMNSSNKYFNSQWRRYAKFLCYSKLFSVILQCLLAFPMLTNFVRRLTMRLIADWSVL